VKKHGGNAVPAALSHEAVEVKDELMPTKLRERRPEVDRDLLTPGVD
jgi:hypothetical protein